MDRPSIEATESLTTICGNCGANSVMMTWYPKARSGGSTGSYFLICPGCGDASVRTNRGQVHPAKRPSRTIYGVPEDVEAAWSEARGAYTAAAYTASEIMCRKILMHVAVDVADSQPGKTFVQYVDDLDSSGYITRGLRPVIDQIRQRGNVANHELPASSQENAMQTLSIVEHLLHSIYELPSLATGTT